MKEKIACKPVLFCCAGGREEVWIDFRVSYGDCVVIVGAVDCFEAVCGIDCFEVVLSADAVLCDVVEFVVVDWLVVNWVDVGFGEVIVIKSTISFII